MFCAFVGFVFIHVFMYSIIYYDYGIHKYMNEDKSNKYTKQLSNQFIHWSLKGAVDRITKSRYITRTLACDTVVAKRVKCTVGT